MALGGGWVGAIGIGQVFRIVLVVVVLVLIRLIYVIEASLLFVKPLCLGISDFGNGSSSLVRLNLFFIAGEIDPVFVAPSLTISNR